MCKVLCTDAALGAVPQVVRTFISAHLGASADAQSMVVHEYKTKRGVTVQLRKGDITNESVDAIVNAANAELMHVSGLAKALTVKGGKKVQELSDKYRDKYGPLRTGRTCPSSAVC